MSSSTTPIKPVSIPVTPAQPKQAVYDKSALYLFEEFNRISYRARFAQEPPPFDATKRPKLWFDSAVDMSIPEAAVEYKVFYKRADGTWTIISTPISVQDAATVNIPPDAFPAGGPPLLPYIEVPIRALLPNEVLTPLPFGLQITRTDLAQAAGQAEGKFTDQDRKVLNAIAKAVGVDVTVL